MNVLVEIPDIGQISEESGFVRLQKCSDGEFQVGKDGVISVTATGDRKVEFIAFEKRTIAYVSSSMGYPAYYPIKPVRIEKPIKAVLMDLDGTSVRSEEFWISIIRLSIASLLGNPDFELENEDLPYVSGHSVSEHLQYCTDKYCPEKNVEDARKCYFEHTHREMEKILKGEGVTDAFKPVPGLKDFILELKRVGIKIGLVTSGLYEKAWPEIMSAFRTLGLGDPKDVYDSIITAGFPLRKGQTGTLGELSPKPHPWLYAEVARVGLGLEPSNRYNIVGLEDSGAGVCSIRLAGFSVIGMNEGNIMESGTRELCSHYCHNFEQVLDIIG